MLFTGSPVEKCALLLFIRFLGLARDEVPVLHCSDYREIGRVPSTTPKVLNWQWIKILFKKIYKSLFYCAHDVGTDATLLNPVWLIEIRFKTVYFVEHYSLLSIWSSPAYFFRGMHSGCNRLNEEVPWPTCSLMKQYAWLAEWFNFSLQIFSHSVQFNCCL